MPNLLTLTTKALQDNQLTFSANIIEKLAHYLELLSHWNQAFNLTAITNPKDMVYLHLIDSMAIAPYLNGKRMLDVGSGAGLPGIPLAIMHPDQHWVLLDKNSKKTRFIIQAIAELDLKNVEAVHSRCEDFHPAIGFDSIVSRAFSTICLFVETTDHLLNNDGIFLAMKGKYPAEELNELPGRFHIQNVARLDINGIAAERHIVQIERRE